MTMKIKQDQNFSGIKSNIDQILIDCSSLKPGKYDQPNLRKSRRAKTQPEGKFNLEKSFDFDVCVKNINTKVRSLQSARFGSLPLFQSVQKKKMSVSENQLKYSLLSSRKNFSRKSTSIEDTKSSHLPRLMAKYQKAYSPRNASSSQKYSPLQKSDKKDKQLESAQKYESYHTLLGERKRREELSYMLVIRRVVKENIVKEKKVLQERKKKRRLDNLKMKEIVLMKSILPDI